jgi:hypothetical protein
MNLSTCELKLTRIFEKFERSRSTRMISVA